MVNGMFKFCSGFILLLSSLHCCVAVFPIIFTGTIAFFLSVFAFEVRFEIVV